MKGPKGRQFKLELYKQILAIRNAHITLQRQSKIGLDRVKGWVILAGERGRCQDLAQLEDQDADCG